MLIIDGDCAFMLGAMERDRDLTLPLEEIRAAPPSGRNWVPNIPDSEAVVSLPEFRRGGVAVIVAKLAARTYRSGSPMWGYRTGDIAYAMARGQAAYYRILENRGERPAQRAHGGVGGCRRPLPPARRNDRRN